MPTPEALDFSLIEFELRDAHLEGIIDPALDVIETPHMLGIISPLDTMPEVVSVGDRSSTINGIIVACEGDIAEKGKQDLANRFAIPSRRREVLPDSKIIAEALEVDMQYQANLAVSFAKIVNHMQGDATVIAAGEETMHAARGRDARSSTLFIGDTSLGGIAVSSSLDVLREFGASASHELQPGEYAHMSALGIQIGHLVRRLQSAHHN